MARSVAERYLVAAFAFLAAATWLGVGVTSGFTCLFVFVLALQAVRLYQRRSGSTGRRAAGRRERRARHESEPAEERDVPPPSASRSRRTRPSGRVYDGDREELGRPVAGEAIW